MPRALLSVSDKSGLLPLAEGLAARGFELVSTGGTAAALEAAGLAVRPVAEVTGFPEMMDGRIKTLHPRVHGGILARRARADHLEAARAHGIGLIDLVVVNLYPFAAAASDPQKPVDDLIEEIDIGGPSLVRAAAKNFADVLVVVSPADYADVLAELDRAGGPSLAFRLALAQKAFAHTAAYDATIASVLADVRAGESGLARAPAAATLPATWIHVGLRKVRDLRYGENPHQQGALYEGFGAGPGWDIIQGRELSYTNLLDLDAAARIVDDFSEPAAVVVKHTNPCGAATGRSAADAYVRARDADPVSAFGGIVGLNRRLDAAAAEALVSTFVEAVIAPSVDEAARGVLARKPAMRVVVPREAGGAASGWPGMELRSIRGGVLVQMRDTTVEAVDAWPGPAVRVVTMRQPTAEEWTALRFAWRLCAHVKSNAVVFAAADRTLAIGAGQMSRVDAVRVACLKAGADRLRGSVAASDAFFPFRDGLDAVAAAGATAVVQPGGSVRDEEVMAAADEHGLAMVFTGRRHFRH